MRGTNLRMDHFYRVLKPFTQVNIYTCPRTSSCTQYYIGIVGTLQAGFKTPVLLENRTCQHKNMTSASIHVPESVL